MNKKIELGMKVECKVTGFTGIAISRIEYLNGCIQYNVAPKTENNEKKKGEWVDEQQLVIIGKGVFVEPKPVGGGFREHPM